MLYFDNAATTALHPKALEAMMPFLTSEYANPSSVYSSARKVRSAIDDARQIVANVINADFSEIFFTSGGTEANNWAIKGILGCEKHGHIITSQVEHHGVLNVFKYLEKQGFEVTYLPVDEEGFIHPSFLAESIRKETRLVSLIFANNEIGTITQIKELAEICNKYNVPFHTDAVQAVGHIPIDVKELGVDMLTLSAHKFNGPKGVGALYIKRGTKIDPILFGGAHERGRRAGTENATGIIGLGAALKVVTDNFSINVARVTKLRDRLINEILTNIPHTSLNGATGTNRLPGNVNISFDFIEGESLLLHLDMNGCCASTGSACSSGTLDPSHVLMAIGLNHEKANGALRFSIGLNNTDDDITELLKILAPAVERLRNLSPLYDDFLTNNKEVKI